MNGCILAGTCHSHLITKNGVVYSFGYNLSGQLGLGDNRTDYWRPTRIPINRKVQKFFCNKGHTSFFVDETSCLYGFGWNGYYQILGENEKTFKEKVQYPKKLIFFSPPRVEEIFCFFSTFVKLENGEVYGFGFNKFGNLGIGNNCHQHLPQKIEIPMEDDSFGKKKIIQIAPGWQHTLFRTSDGNVYGCGKNTKGQLLSLREDIFAPVLLLYFWSHYVVQISSGHSHSHFLTNDGSIFACGDNSYGQLGIGNFIGTSTPTRVPFLQNEEIIKIVSGWHHTGFVSKNKRIFVCGRNYSGQLSFQEPKRVCLPTLIKTNLKLIDFAAGKMHSLFLTDDGFCYAAGNNNYGQLGINSKRGNLKQLVKVEGVRIFGDDEFGDIMKKNYKFYDVVIKFCKKKINFVE